MEIVASIIGHIAWPVAVLVLGYWLVREVRGGLVATLFPNGGTLKAGGLELEIRSAGASLRAAGVKSSPDSLSNADKPNSEQVIADETPYERLIEEWRLASHAIADLASKHGGKRDLRRSYENISLLEERGLLPPNVADAARALFRARNSSRRLPSEQITEEAADEFAISARALTGYIELIQ